MPAPSGSDIGAITEEICEFGLARRSDVGGSLRYKGSIGEIIYVPYTSWAASYIGNRHMNHSTMAHLVLKFHMAHEGSMESIRKIWYKKTNTSMLKK